MSFIGNEGLEPIIQLDSVGIGLNLNTDGNAINLEDLDLDANEYLVVGEKTYYPNNLDIFAKELDIYKNTTYCIEYE